MPDPALRATRWQRFALGAGVLAAFWVAMSLFAPILAPFAAALVIAYVLDPAASAIERIGVHREIGRAHV